MYMMADEDEYIVNIITDVLHVPIPIHFLPFGTRIRYSCVRLTAHGQCVVQSIHSGASVQSVECYGNGETRLEDKAVDRNSFLIA